MELFASHKQHVLDLYCSKGMNCCYKCYWPTLGMPYGNPRFSELGKVLTKVAYERSRMVICTPDWGAVGDNQYWRELLEKLTLATTPLPDEAIYIPLGKNKPVWQTWMGKYAKCGGRYRRSSGGAAGTLWAWGWPAAPDGAAHFRVPACPPGGQVM